MSRRSGNAVHVRLSVAAVSGITRPGAQRSSANRGRHQMNAPKKIALATTLIVALVVGLAPPTAATDQPVETTSGTLMTVVGNFDLAPSGAPTPCPDKESDRVFTTSANGTWSLAGSRSIQYQLPPGSGNWYQADRTVLFNSGTTWSGTAPTQSLAGTLVIQQRIYQLQLSGGPLNCEKNNLMCIINGVFTIDPVTSTYRAIAGPGLPATAPGDEVFINASGPLVVSSCRPPWNSVGGTTATLAGWTMTLV
jgi:hypothetical protein